MWIGEGEKVVEEMLRKAQIEFPMPEMPRRHEPEVPPKVELVEMSESGVSV